MNKLILTLISLLLIFTLAACSSGLAETAPAADASTLTSNSGTNQLAETVQAISNNSVTGTAAVSMILAENQEVHVDAEDYVWDSASVIPITLNGDSITTDHPAVRVDDTTLTITAAGTYRLSGSLAEGQIIVNAEGDGIVRLILDGVDLHSSTSAPIYILAADEAMLVLAEGSENYLSDAASYVSSDTSVDAPTAAIFSMADLTIYGEGSLNVNGSYMDGITSKDGLLIASGNLTVTAVDDGIRGKDYLIVKAGSLTVTAGGDGLKSDNDADAARGYIAIQSGTFNIQAGGDALNAATDVIIQGGAFTLISGGGSNARLSSDLSAKGIKGAVCVIIDGGDFTIDAADDGIHSNGSVLVNAGTFTIASGDDGMHADAALTINNGEIQITGSYEGLESAVITINDGKIHLLARDDGINVAGGADGSGMQPGFGPGARPGRGPGQDTFTYTGSYFLYIHGGYIVVEAGGDGIDVNGAIEMTDGIVLVNGPTENMNGALDYDGGFTISGGLFVAAGSAGMAQAPGANSSQYSLLVNLSSFASAGTLFHIEDSQGEDILTFSPTKPYQSIAFSSPALKNGETYTIYLGGTSTGSAVDGLSQDSAYDPGSEIASFTVSGIVTQIGNGGGRTHP